MKSIDDLETEFETAQKRLLEILKQGTHADSTRETNDYFSAKDAYFAAVRQEKKYAA